MNGVCGPSLPFFVPELPHVTLVELRLALISYQDYHILEANVWGQWCAGGSGVQGAFAHHNTLLAQILVPAGGDGLKVPAKKSMEPRG